MSGYVFHPVALAGAWLLALAVNGLWTVPTAAAETARAELKDAQGSRIGEATLQDTADGVKVSATFTELPPGDHAFHVHAIGRCEPPFESAGGHFNPSQRQHGRVGGKVRDRNLHGLPPPVGDER